MQLRPLFLVPAILAAATLAVAGVGLASQSGDAPTAPDSAIVGAQPPAGVLPPQPVSSRGLSIAFSRRMLARGESFTAFAGLFEPGESVTLWDFYDGGGKAAWLGSRATADDGLLELQHLVSGTAPLGAHTVCAQGMRTAAVACANYAVSATAG